MSSLPAFVPLPDRMPPLAESAMDDGQRAAAAELIAGPRKGVKGPFIPLLRSPELMARLQKVGEYLRFAAPSPRACPSSRPWSYHGCGRNSSQWFEHVRLARAARHGANIDDFREGRRPP